MSERDRPVPESIGEHEHSPASPEFPSVRPAFVPEPESLDAGSVLDLYERARLPAPTRKGRAEPAANLLALIDRYDAFILDGYGVINLGPEPIPGIGDTIRTLRASGREVMVLTNGAGRPSSVTARRYTGWGLDLPEGLVVSSRDALEASLAAHPRPGLWGVMALPDSELHTLPVETALLGDDEALYRRAAGFIFIRSEGWSTARHLLLARALRESPRPVLVANPDVSAPYPDRRLSAEPGYWALRIEAETGCGASDTASRSARHSSSRSVDWARRERGASGSRWWATDSTPTSWAGSRRAWGRCWSPSTGC